MPKLEPVGMVQSVNTILYLPALNLVIPQPQKNKTMNPKQNPTKQARKQANQPNQPTKQTKVKNPCDRTASLTRPPGMLTGASAMGEADLS